MDERLLEKMTGLLSSLHQEIRLVDSQGDSLIPRENASFYLPGGMRAGEVRESKGYLFMRLDMPEAPSLLCPMSDRAEDMLRLAAGAMEANPPANCVPMPWMPFRFSVRGQAA